MLLNESYHPCPILAQCAGRDKHGKALRTTYTPSSHLLPRVATFTFIYSFQGRPKPTSILIHIIDLFPTFAMSLLIWSSPLAENLTNSQRVKGCVAYDPKARAPTYGYVPSLAPAIVFTIVFFVSMLVHIVQVARTRKWWYSALALGAFGTCPT